MVVYVLMGRVWGGGGCMCWWGVTLYVLVGKLMEVLFSATVTACG